MSADILKTYRSFVADIALVIALVLLGLGLRFNLLYQMNAVIDADEAIVGLMAKHIAEGKPWPIFYYGQHYMGSFEAILAATSFKFLGYSSWALKAVPLIFSGIHIALVYVLARHVTDRRGATVASILTALGPSALVLWSTMARGGFIELVVIGTLALILASRIILGQSLQIPRQLFFLGLVLGLGWWVNNQIIFYLAPIGLVLGVFLWWAKGFVKSFQYGSLGIFGFFIGGSPFWYANFFTRPRFQSFFLFERASFADVLSHLRGFFAEALPIIFGARQFWSLNDIFQGSSILVYVVYAVVILVVVWGCKRSEQKLVLCLLLLFCLGLPAIFSASQFGSLSQAPRYLLPAYSVLFVLFGSAFSSLQSFRFLPVKLLGCLMFFSLLFVNAMSNFAGAGAIPGQPFVFKGERVAEDHSKLYAWLDSQNYSHILTNYWIGYRVAFETRERITFSRYRGPWVLRIPEYEDLAHESFRPEVYVLTKTEADTVVQGFSQLGYHFRRTNLGPYSVIDLVERDLSQGNELHEVRVMPEQIKTSVGNDKVSALLDANLGTRWASGMPQNQGMVIDIQIAPESPAISGIDIDYGFWLHDAPRELVIEGMDADGEWCVLFDTRVGEAIDYVLEKERLWQIRFAPMAMRQLRLSQQGEDNIFDWSIAEISLFGVETS